MTNTVRMTSENSTVRMISESTRFECKCEEIANTLLTSQEKNTHTSMTARKKNHGDDCFSVVTHELSLSGEFSLTLVRLLKIQASTNSSEGLSQLSVSVALFVEETHP